jgi:hypothetical protein
MGSWGTRGVGAVPESARAKRLESGGLSVNGSPHSLQYLAARMANCWMPCLFLARRFLFTDGGLDRIVFATRWRSTYERRRVAPMAA